MAGIVIASCSKYPPSSDRLLEDLAVYTKYDTTVDFTSYHTFYMNDSVLRIDSKDSGMVLNSNTSMLTTRIAQDMVQQGYTRVPTMESADLIMAVSYVQNVNVNVYYPGWYWGYYPPYYWGGYYGYYYPYYPAYITSYSTGTVLMDLADLKHPVGNKIPIRWNVYIRGLLTGTHTNNDIQKAIDQAFNQTKGFPASN